MRWEEVAAFIGGPTGLVLLIRAGTQSLEKPIDPSTPEIAATIETLETVSLEAQTTIASPNTLMVLAIMICILIFVISLSLFFRPAFAGWTEKAKRASFRQFIRSRINRKSGQYTHANGQASETGALYYETAVRLGAIIAQSDGQPDPRQLTVVKRIFNLTDETYPEADSLYIRQLEERRPMSAVIKPFLASYGKASTVSETLIFGMTSVAMSDGQVVPAELGLIRMAAEMLGITPAHTKRILMFAGYFGEQQNTRSNQNQSSGTSYKHTSQSERERHLATLGLERGADKAEIRKAWRKLASKYHPDKLVSQNLPPQELEKAEDMMQTINAAYDWLKDNS